MTEKTILSSNTPFIDGTITQIYDDRTNVGDTATLRQNALNTISGIGKDDVNLLGINFSLQNHSDAPSGPVFYQCFLANVKGYADKGDFIDHPITIGPK